MTTIRGLDREYAELRKYMKQFDKQKLQYEVRLKLAQNKAKELGITK